MSKKEKLVFLFSVLFATIAIVIAAKKLPKIKPIIPPPERVVELSSPSLEQIKQQEMERKLGQIRPFRNGIYSFPFAGDEFREVLSAFIDKNPELELASFEGSNYGGSTISYTVHFRKKK